MSDHFISTYCEVGLWDAFHDAEILRLEQDKVAHRLEVDLRADFPHPPDGAASRIGLTFEEVSEWRFWRGEPIKQPDDHIDLDIVWEYLPYSLSDFEVALAEDSPAYLSVAGVTWGAPVHFGFEISLKNLYVASVITAKALIVTADGKPSSLDEWMAWGAAGWEAFGPSQDSDQL